MAGPETPVSITKAEDLTQIYSNTSQVSSTNWDITIGFGRTSLEQEPNGTIKATAVIHTEVTMSPQQAKATLDIFKTAVEGYEKQFGEINVKAKV
ncbi:MAG: DUF3467 domain-containing protein [Nitrospirota bacterium]